MRLGLTSCNKSWLDESSGRTSHGTSFLQMQVKETQVILGVSSFHSEARALESQGAGPSSPGYGLSGLGSEKELIVSNFWYKWSKFFSPVPGWKKRYKSARAGANVFESPGGPECSKVTPWPAEWVPYTVEGDDIPETQGFKFLDGTCTECGKLQPIGKIVSCLRCGVPLCEGDEANMVSSIDPPCCSRCSWIVRFVF